MLSNHKQAVLELILKEGYERRDEAFKLSSGEWSHDYIDAKRAISLGSNLRLVAEAILEVCRNKDATFDAVGGLTMGADPLAHAIALLADAKWFSVRKEAKQHGKQRLIEGAEVTKEDRVLLVDDVITTGNSTLRAFDAIKVVGAEVVLAVAVVDRGKTARDQFAERGIPYAPLLTFEDLGIDPVGAH